MIKKITSSMILLVITLSAHADSVPIQYSLQKIENSIKAKGVEATKNEILVNESYWKYFDENVSKGNMEWLLFAEKLFFLSSNASFNELALSSVRAALDKAPENVLQLQRFELNQLCMFEDLEESYSSEGELFAKIDFRIRKVASVKSSILDGKKKLCLDNLNLERNKLVAYFKKADK